MEENIKEYYVGERRTTWQNRLQGLTALVIGGIFTSTGIVKDNSFLIIGGGCFLTDGASDIITGYHHYAFVRLSEYIESGIKYLKMEK